MTPPITVMTMIAHPPYVTAVVPGRFPGRYGFKRDQEVDAIDELPGLRMATFGSSKGQDSPGQHRVPSSGTS